MSAATRASEKTFQTTEWADHVSKLELYQVGATTQLAPLWPTAKKANPLIYLDIQLPLERQNSPVRAQSPRSIGMPPTPRYIQISMRYT